MRKRLKELYPDPHLELEFTEPFQLLIAAILAAQESDKKINTVGKEFFKKFGTPQKVVNASLEEIEKVLSSVNFYRRKARLIKRCCEVLLEKFRGKIPTSIEEMVKLPGVGRKTANMVLGGAFGLPALIMDRHVLRVSHRLGLTAEKNPDKAEKELEKVTEPQWRTEISLLLMNHGKRICLARNPVCEKCPLCDLCPSCKTGI